MEYWRNKLNNNNVADAVLTDLSIAFDCTIHDLLKTELDASSFCRETVAFIYLYLKSRRLFIKTNGTQSYMGDMISGVSEGSIGSSILYDLFKGDSTSKL